MHGDNGFLWRGAKSDANEQKLGQMLLDNYNCQNKLDFDEGSEPQEFWDLLGGQQAYTTVKDLMLSDSQFEPILFEISNKSGYMWMKQIPAFAQQSLFQGDVYMLDAWNQVFLWIGGDSVKQERQQGYKKTCQYIDALKDGRDKNSILISEIEPTKEPPLFKIQFPNWDDKYSLNWLSKGQLEALMAQHGSGESGASTA